MEFLLHTKTCMLMTLSSTSSNFWIRKPGSPWATARTQCREGEIWAWILARRKHCEWVAPVCEKLVSSLPWIGLLSLGMVHPISTPEKKWEIVPPAPCLLCPTSAVTRPWFSPNSIGAWVLLQVLLLIWPLCPGVKWLYCMPERLPLSGKSSGAGRVSPLPQLPPEAGA